MIFNIIEHHDNFCPFQNKNTETWVSVDYLKLLIRDVFIIFNLETLFLFFDLIC